MRPIHALLLVALLAAVLVGALLLVKSDTKSGRVAPPIAAGDEAPETVRNVPDLDATGAANPARPGTERAEVAAGGKATIPTGPIGLRGRVVDPEGRGVAGATVYAASSDLPMGFALDSLDGASPFMKRKETKTDRDGRFTLEPEVQGAVRLAVRADGFAPFNAQKPIAGTSVDVGDLKLERGVVLAGRVVDHAGRPVANAALHLARASESSGILALPGSRGPVLAETDASGGFRIDRLAAGPWSLLVASAEHPDKTESGETERAGQIVSNLLITLEEGFDITGRVLGVPSAGIGKLRVAAGERNDGAGLIVGFSGQRKSEIAPDGGFRVRGCKRDTEYRLTVRETEQGFPTGSRSDTVTAKSGDVNVVLTYRAETAITLRVVDRLSGQPIEKMHVSAGFRWPLPLMEEGSPKPRTSFPSGYVRFAPVAGGAAGDAATLRIEAVGYATYERKDVRLSPGVDNDIGVIQLDRSALVRVTVLDLGTGAPIQGASVSLNAFERGGTEIGMSFTMDVSGDEEPVFGGEGAAHRGKTDKDGRVDLSSMPGQRAKLSVQHKGHAAWKSEPIDLPLTGDHDVTVRMTAGGTVVVEVVDGDKRPVAGLSIDHRDPDRRGAMFLPGMMSDSVTDAAGRVVFAHIPAGRHAFRVRPPGGPGVGMFEGGLVSAAVVTSEDGPNEIERGWSELDVPEGETVTLTLTAPDLGVLHGRVREGGKPLAGATVRLKPKGQGELDFDLPFLGRSDGVTTNASGEYTLQGTLVGEYELVVSHPSRAMKWEGEATVRTGDTRLDVDLPLATIEGRVLDEAGQPIAGAKVSAERVKKSEASGLREAVEMSVVMIANGGDEGEMISFGGGEAPVVKTDADGRYKLRGVTPGVPLQVVAQGREYQTTRSNRIELGTDQTQSGIDLVLKAGGSIEVVVRRLDGRAVSGAILRAEAVDSEAAPKTLFTGPEGRVTFPGLAPGRWKLTCERTAFDPTSRDSKAPPREVEVRPGKTEKVTFDLPQ